MPGRRSRRDLTVEQAFGRVLRELRERRGLSQEQLGHEVGSGRTYVSQLERAEKRVTLSWIFRVAPSLGTSVTDVVRRVEELSPRPTRSIE